MWMQVLCPCSQTQKRASPLTPAPSLRSLIGPQNTSSFEHHCPPVFFLQPLLFCFVFFFGGGVSLPFGFVGWLVGRKSPPHLLYRPREAQAKSVQNIKHRWPLTHKWVRGKRESPESPPAFFIIIIISVLFLIYHSNPSFLFLFFLLLLLTRFHLTHTPFFFSPRTPPVTLPLRSRPALPLSSVASGSSSGLISIELSCV